MSTPKRSYHPDVNQHALSQELYYDDGAFVYDDEDNTKREFDDRSARFDFSRTEKHQSPEYPPAENGHDRFKQSVNSHQPEVLPPSQPYPLYSGNGQLRTPVSGVPVLNEGDDRLIGKQPYKRIDELPTLVTRKLDPIPEVSEKLSSDGAIPLVSRKACIDDHVAVVLSEHASPSMCAGSEMSVPTAANSSTSCSSLPATTSPVKIAENRVESFPSTSAATINPIKSSLQSGNEFELFSGSQVTVSTVQPFDNDVPASRDQPPTYSLGFKEAAVASADVAENAGDIFRESSLLNFSDKFPTLGKRNDTSTGPEEVSTRGYAALLGNEADLPPNINNNITSVQLEGRSSQDSGSSLETKVLSAKLLDVGSTIEAAPSPSMINGQEKEGDKTPNYYNSSRVSYFDGINPTPDTSLLTAPAISTLENLDIPPVEETNGATADTVKTSASTASSARSFESTEKPPVEEEEVRGKTELPLQSIDSATPPVGAEHNMIEATVVIEEPLIGVEPDTIEATVVVEEPPIGEESDTIEATAVVEEIRASSPEIPVPLTKLPEEVGLALNTRLMLS
ncbi:unnamed protein product [Phytophthora fragariaefolia]|uniref:Unnamed protein product n=1 Tax=Phytophthora fragariaefolia TaxID=1490495 RepID=A0A9W6X8B4_9STRA|nr:unnamed protein product [Phytophthora fragariaefolia]